MIYLKNNTETQAIYIPRQTVLGSGYIATTEKYEEGYNDGFKDGKEQQKGKLSNLNVTENGQYEREDGWNVVNVDVPDLNGSYDEGYEQGHTEGYNEGYTEGEGIGYNQGKTDGINEQKGKLSQIRISENGTYTKEDGYSEVVVEVPDLNGSYDEGYEQGQADIAAKARVLEVTENGVYKSKYSDPIMPTTVTGVYDNGTNFYSYAELNGKIFNTKIAGSVDSRLEFWYKGDNTANGAWNTIIGSGNNDNSDCFQVRYYVFYNTWVEISIGNSTKDIQDWDDTVWHHLIVSKAEGLWIDGKKKGDFSPTNTINGEFFINGIGHNADGSRSANGTFGMVKIDDVVFIPTADGFLNTNTGELLEVVKDGGYTFTEKLPIYGEGELYKTINVNIDVDSYYNNGYNQGKTDGISEQKSKLETISITENGTYSREDGYNEINVNVVPKINIQEAGINFAYSKFTEVPEWADFKGTTSMYNMFAECSNLQTIPLIDTSNVTDMSYMFESCSNLQTIPLIDTSNVTSMRSMFQYCTNLQTIPQLNTSKVSNIFAMFMDCYNLQTIPQIDTSNAWSMNRMFNGCTNLRALPELDASNIYEINDYFGYSDCNYLTDVGGWKNLKCKWNDNYGLAKCPNLTYQSCINVLNGLYDFVGNGSTETRTLTVHKNFLDKVGEEISIATNKGWIVEI